VYLLHYGLANKWIKTSHPEVKRAILLQGLKINALSLLTVAIVRAEGRIEVKRQPRFTIAGYSRNKQELCTLDRCVRVLGTSLKPKTETTANPNKASNKTFRLTVGLEAAPSKIALQLITRPSKIFASEAKFSVDCYSPEWTNSAKTSNFFSISYLSGS